MSAIGFENYQELQSRIAEWLNRDEPETLAQIPRFISLAETRIERNQKWFSERYSIANASNFTVTDNPMALPSYVRIVEEISGANTLYLGPIEIVTGNQLREFQQGNLNTVGIPRFAVITVNYADAATNGPRLTLWPTPAEDFDIDFQYLRRLPRLVSANDTNVLLDLQPDLYLYAALCEAAPYLQHDERLQMWRDRYKEIVDEINLERERQETSGMGPVRLARSF